MTTTTKTTERRHIMAGKNLNAYRATVSPPRVVLDALRPDGTRARQCTAWVEATSVASAFAALRARGILCQRADIRPASGDHFDQVRGAGLLDVSQPGTVVATTLDVFPGDAIALVRIAGATGVRVAAYWRMDKSVKTTFRSIELV